MIHDLGILGMPIGLDSEFTPLHIGDLGESLVSVTFPSGHYDDDHDNGDNNSLEKALEDLHIQKSKAIKSTKDICQRHKC